ncbi:MAG: DUF692 family protein [Blastocatellia bacterium]|nr:DUF692 family protein [Blastocatellia bacterium]
MTSFEKRVSDLPRLGVGISGEFGSSAKGIDACWFHENYPTLLHFFEYGTDIDRGLDEHVRRCVAAGLPTTYHFLDINLEELIDLDDHWVNSTTSLAREIDARWLCGDAGRWHFSSRERGHQMLMPPILCKESALETAESIKIIQQKSGMLCLPENPPAIFYLGDMHILDYFSLVADKADCGILLDCAHLAIYQHSKGFTPTTGFDNFPFDRVVEAHIAGGSMTDVDGYRYIDDNHSPEPVEECWQILEHLVSKAKNLKAIVYECELNNPEECIENFVRLNELFPLEIRVLEGAR